MMVQKYLTVLFLLFAMLLVSANSFAQEVKSGVAEDVCACLLLDNSADERGDSKPEHCPGSHEDDCCDGEGFSPDATAPSVLSTLRITAATTQLLHPPANSFIPKVYLTIFVPPENSF